MIKGLRKKFITVSVLSVFAALLLIMSSINFLNYRDIESECDKVIEILQKNNGRFPGRKEGDHVPADPSVRPPMDGLDDRRPEMEYDSRFFIVNLNSEGDISSIDLEFIASVDEDTARELAGKVISKGSKKGFLSSYRFARSENRIIFLEASRELQQFRSFLVTSGIISAMALILAFLIIFILSGRILAPVAESYEKQKRFITDAGHELKTPLAIIKADLDVIELDECGNEWTDDIGKQVERLSSLTNDLIHLSRMEEVGKAQRIAFPISDVAEETAESFKSAAALKNKSLEVKVTPALSYEGDERSIRELFNILLDNAVKYAPENERILFRVGKQGRGIEVICSNKAPGMTSEQVSHLFDRFYRADKSRNSSNEGFGIGLSVAKAIVDNHDGRIEAQLEGDELVFRIVL